MFKSIHIIKHFKDYNYSNEIEVKFFVVVVGISRRFQKIFVSQLEFCKKKLFFFGHNYFLTYHKLSLLVSFIFLNFSLDYSRYI